MQTVSVSDLLRNRPEVLSPVIGYNTLPGNYPLAGLQAGELLNTTASFANATNGVPLQLTVSYGGGNTAQVVLSTCDALVLFPVPKWSLSGSLVRESVIALGI